MNQAWCKVVSKKPGALHQEQAIYGRVFDTIEDVRQAVADFVELYNESWLIEKNGYLSPRRAREAYYVREVGLRHEPQRCVQGTGCGTLGYSLDELLDKQLWEIGPFKDSPATRSAILEVQKKSYIRYEDLPLETRVGEIVDVEFVCNLYASGVANVIQCNIRDIRKRKQREDREKLRSDDLDRYARTVSHDLRSPLASIGLTTVLLEERLKELLGAEGDEEAAELVESIKKNTDKAHDLISSLLSLAEIGFVSDNIETVDVGAVVGDIVEEYKVVLAQKDTKVQVGKDLGKLVASPAQIRQVFANLIANAIEYSHNEHTIIEVAYLGEDDNGGGRYIVRDNGPGIPENLLGRLFLPFVSQKGHGKGLGLAIVYTVVRGYGGSVRAYNDHGACIEFSLKDLGQNSERI